MRELLRKLIRHACFSIIKKIFPIVSLCLTSNQVSSNYSFRGIYSKLVHETYFEVMAA